MPVLQVKEVEDCPWECNTYERSASLSCKRFHANTPNCMQLILQLWHRRPLFNEFPNIFQLLSGTRFKALRIMEDKVASIICNLVLNVMYASLMIIALLFDNIFTLLTHLNGWHQMCLRRLQFFTCHMLYMKM